MTVFRIFLAGLFLGLSAYSAVTIANHGLNLFGPFFGDMAKMGWPGQFNFDFMMMLALSGLWTAWRHQFSGKGILLGICAFFGGALFLSAYLFILTGKSKDMRLVLLGPGRT